MFWNDEYEEPFTISPNQHEEINVMARPEEVINHDQDCQADLHSGHFDKFFYRLKGADHLFLRSALFELILFQNIDMLKMAQMRVPGLL